MTGERQGWLDVAEKGGVLGIRAMVFVSTMLGRRAAMGVVYISLSSAAAVPRWRRR